MTRPDVAPAAAPPEIFLATIFSGAGHANEQSGLLIAASTGGLRFYISNGNALKQVMWCVDSADGGAPWTAPRRVQFAGFAPAGVNWAHVVRVTDPAALATLAASGPTQTQP